MADNISVTPGSGATLSTDDIGGVGYPRVKLTLGADGVNDGDVSSANPMPVEAASLPLPTGASTSAKQDAQTALLTTIDADTSTLAGAVSGSEMQVDVVTSALPTGASTAANQTTIIGHVDGIETLLGTIDADTGNIATSVAGLLTDAQLRATPVPVSGTVTANLGTIAGVATEAKQDTQITSLQLLDDTVETSSGNKFLMVGGRHGPGAGAVAEMAVDSSGNVQVDVVTSALPTNASTLTEQQSQTTLLGTIDTDTGSMASSLTSIAAEDFATETTLAAVKTAVEIIDNAISGSEMQVDIVTMPNVTLNQLDVVDFIDTTPVLDTSSTNIPGSASNPVEIVASLAANVKKLKINDTTGFYIGVYTGAALSEVLQCIVGPGEDGTIDVSMSSAERVSLRAMAATAISSGELSIQFLG